MLVSIVVPCYRSEHTIGELVELTMAEFDKLEGYECEFVLVNDCSPDNTWDEIKRLGGLYPNVHGINLMRNFGQHSALMCAMNHAQGELIMGMDDDLQTHPSQLSKILAKMQEGYDLVYGMYAKSTNSAGKQLTSWFNKVSARVLLGRPKNIRSSNFWCITRAVCDEVIRCKSFSPYVDGIFFRTTHNIGNVVIEHHKREYGESGYSLLKLMKLWLAYFNYSVVPLRIASVIGVTTAGIGFVAGITPIIRKLVNPNIAAGWTSIICLMLFLAGLILFMLGIVGEYVGDAVMMLNGTPQFIEREYVNPTK